MGPKKFLLGDFYNLYETHLYPSNALQIRLLNFQDKISSYGLIEDQLDLSFKCCNFSSISSTETGTDPELGLGCATKKDTNFVMFKETTIKKTGESNEEILTQDNCSSDKDKNEDAQNQKATLAGASADNKFLFIGPLGKKRKMAQKAAKLLKIEESVHKNGASQEEPLNLCCNSSNEVISSENERKEKLQNQQDKYNNLNLNLTSPYSPQSPSGASLSSPSQASVSYASSTSPTLKKKLQCPDCDKEFSQLRNYRYHRSKHEGTNQFACTCPICGKSFNDKGYLSSHLKIHRNQKEYQCEWCEKSFNQRVAYNMHVRIHTGHKPHKCHLCAKAFSRKMLLRQHLRTHTGERPYKCEICSKSFADRSNMLLHQRLHTGQRPYACKICGKSFSKNHHLKTHLNHHAGIKPYQCTRCSAFFSQSSNMKTHFRKCTGNTTTTTGSPTSTNIFNSTNSTNSNSNSSARLHTNSTNLNNNTSPTSNLTSQMVRLSTSISTSTSSTFSQNFQFPQMTTGSPITTPGNLNGHVVRYKNLQNSSPNLVNFGQLLPTAGPISMPMSIYQVPKMTYSNLFRPQTTDGSHRPLLSSTMNYQQQQHQQHQQQHHHQQQHGFLHLDNEIKNSHLLNNYINISTTAANHNHNLVQNFQMPLLNQSSYSGGSSTSSSTFLTEFHQSPASFINHNHNHMNQRNSSTISTTTTYMNHFES